MNKILCASQNTEAKTLPGEVCVFGHFGRLLPAAVYSVDSHFNSKVKWWINFHLFTQKLFYCIETVANNALNLQHVVVLNRLWANAEPTLNIGISLTNVNAKWWIHCLLISSTPMLSHATSIYDRPIRVYRVLWCFPEQL